MIFLTDFYVFTLVSRLITTAHPEDLGARETPNTFIGLKMLSKMVSDAKECLKTRKNLYSHEMEKFLVLFFRYK